MAADRRNGAESNPERVEGNEKEKRNWQDIVKQFAACAAGKG